jgi:hypothetical protein
MVNKRLDEVINKDFHPQAKELIIQFVEHFATTLILQAKTLAFNRDAELILKNDVQDALDSITREQKQIYRKQFVIVIGGALFGAFVQGFVTSLSDNNTILLAIYTVMGFVGMLFLFIGLR